ncbi:ABC transporter permease [Nakamurella deserti]|uniref:ABC transporter permease n=1 Tax=Nakamurella deserti TaxID=2164074 RepID=UPI000DBE15E3|nr:ABC transporter permease [Nakamurella deserti]
MVSFIGRRLVAGVLLVVGISFVAFILTNLVPGDPAAAALGQRAIEDPATVAAFRAKYGLDEPLWRQYLIYLGNLVQGDLGTSQQTRRPVGADIAKFLPATAELALAAIVISLVVGLALGIVAAVYRDRFLDSLIRVLSLGGVSVPTFWLALAASVVFSVKLGWLPSTGQLDPGMDRPTDITGMVLVDSLLTGNWETFGSALEHIIMPAVVLAAYTIGMITRFTRASMLEVLGNDYIRAARAKGLPERTVLFRHVLRPALVPIITVTGLALGSLLSGTVLVENIFSWPGMGQYAYKSSLALDLPAVMGVSIVIAVIYVVVNLVVDILYSVIDPRIRQG